RPLLNIGEEVSLSVRLTQPGETIIELMVADRPDELTPLNNRAVVSLTAIRDRLRVLLISGKPHAGERVWRNILKSDPAVDLIHFTILRPANKVAIASRQELNLIEFPHEELFLDKLSSFDVVIFDRYTYRQVLQAYEFEEIARYVEKGGAVLIAAGPEMSEVGSLANRPNLAYILPILPIGAEKRREFIPARTEQGDRHPITSELIAPEDWGRWLRYVPGQTRRGTALLQTPEGTPLLVVDRVQDGRIGVFMSDHVWLWARGFDGGGPHQELLRRLVHWLMKEPELEEEALRGRISAESQFTIERQSLSETVSAVEVENPEGQVETHPLTKTRPGLFTATLTAPMPGLYRLKTTTAENETLYALVAAGKDRIEELEDVVSTEKKTVQLADQTGGGVWTIKNSGLNIPSFRQVNADRNRMFGDNWAGLIRRDVRQVEAVRLVPVLPNGLWVLFIGGAALLAWLFESRMGRENRRKA
ncbi:MAG: hypothetical protein AAF603_08340, partial [Pseudomonadota bacterium]